MRNDTLVRVLALMRLLEQSDASGDEFTLKDLAKHFEVTTRTIRRDISALEDAGALIGRRHEQDGPGRTLISGLAWEPRA